MPAQAGIQEDPALARGYGSWIPGLALLARNDVPTTYPSYLMRRTTTSKLSGVDAQALPGHEVGASLPTSHAARFNTPPLRTVPSHAYRSTTDARRNTPLHHVDSPREF